MAADLPFPRGKELIARYKRQYGDHTLVGFSRGKDSIAVSLALRDHLELHPVYFYAIPGLPMIEEGLEYYSKVLFHGTRIIKYPEAAFIKWLNSGLYQTPHTHEIIKAADMANFNSISGHQWWSSVTEYVIEDKGLPEKTMTATGVRARDSPMRWLNVKNNGVLRPTKKNWLPVWDYTLADVENAIAKSGVSLPIDYLLFGRSFGGGIDARFLVPLKRHRPEDWKIVCEWFPLADFVVWRYERFVEKK